MVQTVTLPTRKEPVRLAVREAAPQQPAESSSSAGMIVMIMFSLVLIVAVFAGAV